MSETSPITIEVDPQVARSYSAVPAERRRKLDTLLSLKLGDAIRSKRALEEVLEELSRRARERGLTPETLQKLLREE